MQITKTQRTVLINARDTGNPARQANGQLMDKSWTAGYRMMIERLQAAGLLLGDKITEAGRAVL